MAAATGVVVVVKVNVLAVAVVVVANKRPARKVHAVPRVKAKDVVHAPQWVMHNHAVTHSHAATRAALLAAAIASPAHPARHPVVNLTRCGPVWI